MKEQLNVLWQEFETLNRQKHVYAAFLRLADIASVLSCAPPDVRQWYESKLSSVSLDSVAKEHLQEGILSQYAKISRIMSVGDKWNEDELLLLITIKVQIDLLLEFLASRGVRFESSEESKISIAISEIASSPSNVKTFKRAALLARRNWGVPIRHKLFS